MSNKYRFLNNFIWLITRIIVALVLVAMSLFLVKTVDSLKVGDGIHNLTVGILWGIGFLLLGFGVVRTYNNMKKNILLGENNSIKNKKGSYQLRSVLDPKTGQIIHSIIRNRENGSYGANLYSGASEGGEAVENSTSAEEETVSDIPDECAGEEISHNNPFKENIKRSMLDDIQGIDELKADIHRIIDSLVNPHKYSEMGAKPTKGVLLTGPPGTGKTMLAKAIAHDSNATFLYANGSDFIEKFVGVGAQRVRELFRKAKQSTPSIIFIDEIDAIAIKRDDASNQEGLQTINAFLAELDGFVENSGVLVIAATNRPEALDSAFTRAGRFDLKLAVGLPDREGREKILEVHARNKKLAEDINLYDLASKTTGFSGAELANLLNESALLAAGLGKECISNEDINEAFFKIIMHGHKKKLKDEKTLELIAWHEAGHALAIKKLTNDGVSSVTIIGSTSGAGGVTFRNPSDYVLESKEDIENQIKTLYAGRAAEEILLGDSNKITTGASNDIKQATKMIKRYLEVYGMGGSGLVDLTQFQLIHSDLVKEASEVSKKLYNEVLEELRKEKKTLGVIAERLLDKETIYEDELDSILGVGE